jgi:cytochrome c1
VFFAVFLSGCRNASGKTPDRVVEGGNAERGRATIVTYGCGSCHMIPGVPDAVGLVGPPLDHWAERRIIAGEVPNDPERLITWITVPQSIEPGTAMPNMGVTDGQARDIAAYLYTLH